MCDKAIQTIFRAVIIAKLTYAASAWRGFTKTSDRQRIDALIRLAKRCGYYDSDLPLFDELCDNADEQLFDNVRRNSHHTLHNLLSPEPLASQNYSLRIAVRIIVNYQNIIIISMTVILLSVCFIRMLYKNPVLLTLWTRFLSYHFIVVL